MMVLIIVALVIVLPVIWVLFLPVLLVVDTDNDIYRISQAGTLRMDYHPAGRPSWELRIFGIRVTFAGKQEENVEPPRSISRRRKFHRSIQSWLFFIRRSIQSFKVRRLVADVDTDDVVINAQLVPLLLFMSRGPVSLATNFEGRRYLYLEIEGRLSRLLWVFILFLTKK